MFDRLLDTARLVLNSEHIYLFELDPDDDDSFVLSHAHIETCLGFKLRKEEFIEGNNCQSCNIENYFAELSGRNFHRKQAYFQFLLFIFFSFLTSNVKSLFYKIQDEKDIQIYDCRSGG